ncbi:MAG: bifunctional hydroxymethylpyrimidine kinase/phosphomethylpyrimidine kinase, partial [Pseudomonadota bacterium]
MGDVEDAQSGRVLSIGLSDCLGRAGLQGDVRAVTATGGRASTVVTVVTADDTNMAFDWVEMSPTIIVRQFERILAVEGVDCIKIGQLHSEEQIELIANLIARRAPSTPIVISPVVAAVDGAPRLSVRAAAALKRSLMVMSELLCVSVREAEVLTGMTVRDEDAMMEAAAMMLTLGLNGVFLHGGSFGRDHATDILATEDDIIRYDDGPPGGHLVYGAKTALAAAAAGGVAKGMTLQDAVAGARAYLKQALPTLRTFGGAHRAPWRAVDRRDDRRNDDRRRRRAARDQIGDQFDLL